MKITDSNDYHFTAIGFVETCFKERFGTPRQSGLVPSSWGVIRLRPELNLSEALQGLEGFSHLWLIFVFHQNENKGVKTKVHPPRLEGESIGVFATRSPHRPNPIGLSVVRQEKIQEGAIWISGVDLVDGTPILDIKPYLSSADQIPTATSGWTEKRLERTLEVEFDSQALDDIKRLFTGNLDRARSAIEEILALDPRPVFYRGTPANPDPYTAVYGFRLADANVVYRMIGTKAQVISLEPWDDYQNRK